ncbi:MAG: MBOAT family protein [Crocinitomicaceae bacterium]|nr:MBOAT family protein [Crocinitomicaceae bacterium]
MIDTFDFSRITEVFSFQFNPETAFLFTKVEFWIFFVAVMIAYVLLEANKYIRTATLSVVVLLTSWFFQNGDFIVFGGLCILNYAFLHALFKAQKKYNWIFLLISVNALAAYYFWFKVSYFKIYFTIRPIDVWLVFIIVIFILSYFKQKTLVRSIFLTIVSLYFYYKSSDKFVYLLIFSIVLNYYLGRWVFFAKGQLTKKWIVAITVIINVAILAYFKYTYFFTNSFNTMFGTNHVPTNIVAEWGNWLIGEPTFVTDILLPVGVSFFTFQTISYVVDIYRNEVGPVRNIFDYAFYTAFFPPLVSGPILRARDFIPQIYKPFHLTKVDYSMAVIMIVTGLLKKVVMADYIAIHFIDKVADAPAAYPGFVSVMAMWGYSLQIYGDFSGYTDIAIGISLLMGFRLPENFNSPYKSVSVADFWRRWHKSLGAWLKDYLYIPLGGNRSGGLGTFIATFFILIFLVFITRWYALFYVYAVLMTIYFVAVKFMPGEKKKLFRDMNLMITLVVGGLWHGASQNFVIWGAMNGVALVIYNYWKIISPYENKNNLFVHFWKIFITFNFITFTRIWFRLDKDGMPNQMLDQIWNHFDFTWDRFVLVLETYQSALWIILIGFIIHWLPAKWKDAYKNLFTKMPIPLQLIAVSCIIFLMYQAMTGESKAFVYFQF